MEKAEFNKQRMEALENLKKPIEDFMNKWCCPHDTLVATQGYMEIVSGEIGIPLEVLD